MNTIKKIALFAAVAMATVGLKAGTLYWQISNNPNNDTYAAVVVEQNGTKIGYLNQLDGDGGSVVSPVVAASDAMANVQYADITDYSNSSYSFYVEMLSMDGGEWVQGWTGPKLSYDNISSYISTGGIGVGSLNTWTATVSIPEPTSGLLLLIGGSLLALRRRRRA